MFTMTIDEILHENKKYLEENGLKVKMVTEKKDIRSNRERMVGMLVKKNIIGVECDAR